MSDRFTLIFVWVCAAIAAAIAIATGEWICIHGSGFSLGVAISYSITLSCKRRIQECMTYDATDEYEVSKPMTEVEKQQLREHITKVTK